MTPADRKAVGLLVAAATDCGSVPGACDVLEAAAPHFRWMTAAERWACVDVARSARDAWETA